MCLITELNKYEGNAMSCKSELTFEVFNEYGTDSVLASLGKGRVLLSAEDIDALIDNLSAHRVKLAPPITPTPSKSHKYVVENASRWHTESNPLFDGAILFFRHTGLGWNGFAIPQNSLGKLIDAITTCTSRTSWHTRTKQ